MPLSFSDKTQIGLLIVTAALFFWCIGFYSGGQKAEVLKQKLELSEFADEAKLSELISTLKKTSAELLNSINKNKLLAENSNLKGDLNEATIENEAIKKELKEKEKIISELGLTHSSLVLRPGETKKLFNGEFIISLDRTDYTSVSVIINNKLETIYVGKYYEFMAGSKPAKLILESVNWGMNEPNSATFTILINNGEPDA
jgi:hypothetical protein